VNWTSENAIAVNQVSIDPVTNPMGPVLVPKAKPRSKHSMLPVLVVLFLVAWGLMAGLIVEQGRTIETQRTLIRSLFQDSSQLSHLKGQLFQKQQADAKAQAAAKAHSQAETPSTQDKTRIQVPQDPAKQQAKNSGKVQKRAPQPPTDADTLTDERRTVLRI
jgi:hypothetical protein